VLSQLNWRMLFSGIRSYVPLARKSGAHTEMSAKSSRYCYTVWLRHLVSAYAGGSTPRLDCVAELGPGGSLGVGLAAMLSGANRYYGFDVVPHCDRDSNLLVFDELVDLFTKRTSIPGEEEFPRVGPRLPNYQFPHSILTDEILGASLLPERVAEIRRAICGNSTPESSIHIAYAAPWRSVVVEPHSVDFILSQAVLEHVDDVVGTYHALSQWIRPGGLMSHQIDLRAHSSARDWNGHWTISEPVWKLIRGRHAYVINRLPSSTHVAAIQEAGFDVLAVTRVKDTSGITRDCLTRQFAGLSDEDLVTAGIHILARMAKSPRNSGHNKHNT